MNTLFKALSHPVRRRIVAMLRAGPLASGDIAAAFGATADVDFRRGYPVTVNHADATEHAAAVAREVAGDIDMTVEPMMGGEDFSYMLEQRPGAYIFVGNGDSAMVHHPAYNFDDDAIPAGSSWYAGMVEARMPAA